MSHEPGHVTIDTLSPRETEVLRLAALGLSNTELAKRLGVTVHAVKFHLASIYRKLGAGNRTEAVVVYLQSSAGPAVAARSHGPEVND